MHRVKEEVDQRLAADPALAARVQQAGGIKLVYDHVRYHDRAASILNLEPWHKRVQPPPWTPDFNRPVERAFGTIKDKYKKREEPVQGPDLMQAMKDRIIALVRKHITPEAIRRDVATMPFMLRVIKSKRDESLVGPTGKVYHGVYGGWTPPELR